MPPSGSGVVDALRHAAQVATRAPSILNTQPWRWRVHEETLELYADPTRQVKSIDPDRRLLTFSCGAALHHARVDLTASGLEPAVNRLPDADAPDLLARLDISGPHQVRPADLRQAGSIRRRHTDRRAVVAAAAIDDRRFEALRKAAAEEGVRLHRITPDQRPFLALAATRAQQIEAADEAYQRDLVAWTDERARGEGVPIETLVAGVARPVPLRDFAGGGETGLYSEPSGDANADFLVVYTHGDEPVDWLRAGEATSATWLTGTADDVVMSVLSDVIEVPGARAIVASLLPEPGSPQIVLRVGIAAQPTPPPASPRRDPHTVIEVD